MDKTEVHAQLGEKVSLTCFAFNQPLWFFQTLTSEPIAQSVYYNIQDMTEEDEGDYFCVGLSVYDTYFVAKTKVIIYCK